MTGRSSNALFFPGPPFTWHHALHQVTGLIALRGNKLTADDRAEMIANLRAVLEEIEDDQKWLLISHGNRQPR